MNTHFTPEARAELLAMYAGMALQGLLNREDMNSDRVANYAVDYAVDLVDALERHHAAAAVVTEAV